MNDDHFPEIIMADDDLDDCEMVRQSLLENKIANPFKTFPDGEQLLNYLNQKDISHPCMILLDIKMPKMNGREALALIKKDEKLRKIPVIILTSSKADEDILASYDLGANTYIAKPVTFKGLLDVVKAIKDYWLMIAELPSSIENSAK